MGKQNVVYTYARKLFSLRKGWNSDTKYSMEDP